MTNISGGDDRFYNNILVGGPETGPDSPPPDTKNPQRFTGFGLWVYDTRERPLRTGGNVYLNGARPYAKEANPLALATIDPKPSLVEEGGQVFLQLATGPEWQRAQTIPVTPEMFGGDPWLNHGAR